MPRTEGAEPIPRASSPDLLGADIADEASKPACIAYEYRVPRMPTARMPEDARLTVQRLDGLTIGGHYDAEGGEIHGEDTQRRTRLGRADSAAGQVDKEGPREVAHHQRLGLIHFDFFRTLPCATETRASHDSARG